MGASSLLLLAVLVGPLGMGCQDNEQRARALGSEARDAVSLRCAPDAGGGDEEATCVSELCRAECAKRDVAPGFATVCLDTCRQTAICASSADCGVGKECVAIAPVVRRCVSTAAPAGR